MKKWLGIAAGIVGVLILYVLINAGGKEIVTQVRKVISGDSEYLSRQELVERLPEFLARAAAKLQNQLPMQVDPASTLQSVTVSESTTVYNYRIDMNIISVGPEKFMAAQRSYFKNYACNSEDSLWVMKIGGVNKYVFRTVSGGYIGELEVRERDCKYG